MAPMGAKRARHSFSPPRPGKNKTKTVQMSSLAGRKKTSKGVSKSAQKQAPGKKQRQRGTGGTMRAILNDADEDEDEEQDQEDTAVSYRRRYGRYDDDEDESDEEDDDDDDDGRGQQGQDEDEEDQPAPHPTSSPEPEFILAEVATTAPRISKSVSGPSTTAMPAALIHRIMHSQFMAPDQTNISTDARALFATYVEIFVKEAIRRCVDEKKDRQGVGEAAVDSGWLEVEDLERVATQLCLDF
ncbi:hypothetical protein A1O3_03120 [Capronia epimyces CBS 606.96]|uniref:Uncharacterized protein n=1 Tax=Capronia epimyces CBS 606.96 TaxID=1182542 RepID=W9YB16_9EURO|nr:uncharacterized protein A1O3_03120 [Capronia epimyces CBS 606.96]EXJ90052.1 hypothetical protein A1O3_03120 [Capronia epimyces CBS 606.96]